jgi:hypothetical protein
MRKRKSDLINSLLEQHFEWVRHNESERWWVMGAWLATTGYVIREVFTKLACCKFGYYVFVISLLHLLFSLIILCMLLKHTLEVKRLLEYVDMIVKKEGYGEK